MEAIRVNIKDAVVTSRGRKNKETLFQMKDLAWGVTEEFVQISIAVAVSVAEDK